MASLSCPRMYLGILRINMEDLRTDGFPADSKTEPAEYKSRILVLDYLFDIFSNVFRRILFHSTWSPLNLIPSPTTISWGMRAAMSDAQLCQSLMHLMQVPRNIVHTTVWLPFCVKTLLLWHSYY